MAVKKVKAISIIGMLTELDSVLKVCGESGVFHPDDALSFFSNTQDFRPVLDDNPYEVPLKKLKKTVYSAGLPLELVDISDFSTNLDEANEYINYFSSKVDAVLSKRDEIKIEIENLQKSISDFSHFVDINVDLEEIFKFQYIKFRFGRIPKENYLKLDEYTGGPDSSFFFSPCSDEGDYCWGVYFAISDTVEKVDKIFSRLGFETLKLPEYYSGTSENILFTLKFEMQKKQILLGEIEEKLSAFLKAQEAQYMRFYSKLEEFNTYFNIRNYASKYHNSFILLGWISEESEKSFCKELDKITGIEYSLEEGKNELKHSPPVKLKNNKMFSPFEFFIDMYGLPSYNEVDPTAFVAITYILLFGIMFGDLGQGLLLSAAGYFMYKLKGMKFGKILVSCGISSAFFGFLFGSVFGFEHALNPVYKLLFGLNEKPFDVMESGNISIIIYSAVSIGVCLVIVAMLINIYSSIKKKKYGNALFGPNGLAGVVLYSSVIFGVLIQFVFGVKVLNLAYILAFVILPLLLIVFGEILGKLIERRSDWLPESWGDYLTQNLFELFEVILSYVTNTVSFLRVGAFILIHAGMMMVVFTLAEMLGGIGYFIAVVAGNILVMCLEALLAGIQVLRLEFYEMFSRFFDGQGRAFEPVRVKKSS